MKQVLFALTFAVAIFGCSKNPFKTTSDCYYRVTSNDNSGVSVTYESAGGGTSQKDVTTPWNSETFSVSNGGFVYISAQRTSPGSGTVTVYIFKDGKEWKNTSSSGEYVIATASGSF